MSRGNIVLKSTSKTVSVATMEQGEKNREQNIAFLILKYGECILNSDYIQQQKQYMQHGNVSVYAHCINVAYMSLILAGYFHLNVNQCAIVRGALLHDYFLYDWHITGETKRWHGFTHAKVALKNAMRDFELTDKEKDIIQKHMFPMNPALPKYKESIVVGVADKLCAIFEILPVGSFAIPFSLEE